MIIISNHNNILYYKVMTHVKRFNIGNLNELFFLKKVTIVKFLKLLALNIKSVSYTLCCLENFKSRPFY